MSGRCDRCGQRDDHLLRVSTLTSERYATGISRSLCGLCWTATIKWIDECANRGPKQVTQDEAAQPANGVLLRCSVCSGEHWGTVGELGKTCGRVPSSDQCSAGLCRGILQSDTVRWTFEVPIAFESIEVCCNRCGLQVLRPHGARGTPTEERFWVRCNRGHEFLAQFWRRQR